jgi:hypothetical protein
VGNRSLGCRWLRPLAPALCFQLCPISQLLLSNQLPWADGMPGGVHRLPSRETRLQSGSKISSSNFQYPSQKGRLRSKSQISIFQKKDLILESARILGAAQRDPALDLLIHSMIAQLEFFEQQLAQLDLHIQRIFSSMAYPIKTIPGIGLITGAFDRSRTGRPASFRGPAPSPCSVSLCRHGSPGAQKRPMERQNQNE